MIGVENINNCIPNCIKNLRSLYFDVSDENISPNPKAKELKELEIRKEQSKSKLMEQLYLSLICNKLKEQNKEIELKI